MPKVQKSLYKSSGLRASDFGLSDRKHRRGTRDLTLVPSPGDSSRGPRDRFGLQLLRGESGLSLAWAYTYVYIYIYIYTHTFLYIYIYMSARQHRHEMGCYSYSLRTSLGYWMRREFRLRAPERNTLPLRASSGITVLLYHCVLCCCAAVVLPRCWVVPCMQGVLRHAARLQGLFIYVYREREVCTHTTLYKIVTFMLYNIIMCTYIYIYIYIHIWGGNLEARPRRGHLGRRESNLLYYSII